MKIRMLRTQPGSIDGLTLKPFEKGEVYDLSGTDLERSLAGNFMRAGWAEEVREPREVAPPPTDPEPVAPAAEEPLATSPEEPQPSAWQRPGSRRRRGG